MANQHNSRNNKVTFRLIRGNVLKIVINCFDQHIVYIEINDIELLIYCPTLQKRLV
ncbi:MAG: RNA chaperone Hfq [Acinetobacter sp.]|nr:RNA chaperone Hfq [Acinetobacter sp.]